MFKRTAGFTLLMGFSALSHGADNGFYLGVGFGQSNASVRTGNVSFSDQKSGYQAFAGFRLLDRLGVEAAYADLGGSGNLAAGDINASAATVSLNGYLPMPVIDLYAKAGMSKWDSRSRTGNTVTLRNGTDFTWGAGLQAHFTSLGLRLEYQQIDTSAISKLSQVSVGFSYTFL